MTAPALVMVAHGSTDPRVARLAHALRAELHAARPQIAAHVGFLENVGPTVAQLLSRLSAQGVSEAVLVPLAETVNGLGLGNLPDEDIAVARKVLLEIITNLARDVTGEGA